MMEKTGSRLGFTLAATAWGGAYPVTAELVGAPRTLLPTMEAGDYV